jgi:hypothetical protein
MASHLEETVKAMSKCRDEAKKLEKQYLAAKTPQEKEKITKMADACKKMAMGYFNMIDSAKDKDKKEMGEILGKINPAFTKF